MVLLLFLGDNINGMVCLCDKVPVMSQLFPVCPFKFFIVVGVFFFSGENYVIAHMIYRSSCFQLYIHRLVAVFL